MVRTEITTSGATALSLHGSDRDVAITPDGLRIVYRGENQLLVRALDQLTPTALTGLGAPRGVFISPDGQWVGFFDTAATLKKVATDVPGIYSQTADGRRFLMIKKATAEGDEAAQPQVIVVQNWSEELKRLVPTP